MEITHMFTERVIFFLQQAQMTCYVSMLKTNIRQFIPTQRYDTLLELQEAARRRELKIELHLRE